MESDQPLIEEEEEEEPKEEKEEEEVKPSPLIDTDDLLVSLQSSLHIVKHYQTSKLK